MSRTTRILLTAGAATVVLIVIVSWLYGLRPEDLGSLRLFSPKPLDPTPEQQVEIDTWLRDNTIQLRTVQPGSPMDDLRRLKPMFADASIVALGEEAHLNRTFSRAKHRVVEYLVTELDFTVFAIEGTFGGALELNDYLLTGNGDPSRALAALMYPAWNIEAILDMVIWMRQYNATHEKKVKFYGFDLKPATGSAIRVREYLKGSRVTNDYEPLLSTMANPWTAYQLTSGPKPEIHRAAEQTRALIADLQATVPASPHPPAPAATTDSRKQWALALQHARVLLQHLEFYSAGREASALRDEAMAENVRWIIDHEDGAKTILWAANGHIAAGSGSGCMGEYLRRTYGDGLVIMALMANRKSQGSDDNEPVGEPHIWDDGTLETALTRAGLEIAALDFRSLPAGIVSRYFNAPLNTRAGTSGIYPLVYDAVLFIESTFNARMIQRGPAKPTSILETPSNLDFEERDGDWPKDWTIKGGQTRAEYRLVGSSAEPVQGERCAAVERIPGRSFNGSYGNAYQVLKATEFRGGRIRFSAAARATDGTAYLYLGVEKTARSPGSFQQVEITSETWREYRLEAEVPEQAREIFYGLAYLGQEAAYIDNAKIESLSQNR